MADWISLDNGFYHHRKTLRLKRVLRDAAYWIPPRLWGYCVEHKSGDISKLDDTDLVAVLEYDGDGASLRKSLIDAGFLSPDGRTVVGWAERYEVKLLFYHERAVKASAARWGKNPSMPAPSSEPETRPDQTETRPDKIRKHRQASLKDASSMLEASNPAELGLEPEITAEMIYDAYPLKVGRDAALMAIKRALRKHPASYLLESVTAWAAAVTPCPPDARKYIPRASKWFNDGRFSDDRSEWKPPTAPTNRSPQQNGRGFAQQTTAADLEKSYATNP